MKEYPPILIGTAEEQLQQLRGYLIRQGNYIDELQDRIDDLESANSKLTSKLSELSEEE